MSQLPLDLLGASSLACARHREALAELAERSEPTPDGAAALAHLDRCDACADTLGDLTLTVIALRRMAADGDTTWFPWPTAAAERTVAETGDSAWARLRDRIEHSRRVAREQAWRWRTSLGGLVASALVVAALVGPTTVRPGSSADFSPTTGNDLDEVSAQIEADYVFGAHALPPSDATSSDTLDGSVIRRYPDDLRPVRKEVPPARSSALSPDAR